MKKRNIALIILVSLVLIGCGSSKPNEGLDKITNEIVTSPDGSIWNPTEAPVGEQTTVPTAATQETTAEEYTENADTGTTAKEEAEKYYLAFEATTTEGEAWNSDQLANSRLTMINIWGTYCNPCLAEMPYLGEIATEYDAADFQLIGIICDVADTDGVDAVKEAKELIMQTKANYPHLLLSESLYSNLVGAVTAVPTTFFVRQDGSLIGYVTGAMSKENWKSLIDQLLADQEEN